ncbi:MAG: ABC transporter ATP-binding protein, partial [Gemmataceae bacterium]
QDVAFQLNVGEFVAVIGPSGCGKSTLLKCLSGELPPTGGQVFIDDCDLYRAPAGVQKRLSIVPQREILPTPLRVAEALGFTAALRLPADTTLTERHQRVQEVLGIVGLQEQAQLPIHRLSGGQVKRVGLANELLADPGIVFLDEVTSGLDEQADREMMALFRQLTMKKQTVLAVTHTLAQVMEFCHRVIILTRGGRLAYIGPPTEALTYFGIDRLGDIYDRLEDRTPEDWAEQFRRHPNASRAATGVVPTNPEPIPAEPTEEWAIVRHQVPIVAERTMRVLLADPWAMLVTLGQAILIATLVVAVFGTVVDTNRGTMAVTTRSVLFILTVTAFWLGCHHAANEIVREWPLFRK